MGLPDLRRKKKGKEKVSKVSYVSEALDKLREQTRETVKGLESMSGPKTGFKDLGKDAMIEDWVKQFEELAGSQVICSLISSHNWGFWVLLMFQELANIVPSFYCCSFEVLLLLISNVIQM